jgi:hypothetical protein
MVSGRISKGFRKGLTQGYQEAIKNPASFSRTGCLFESVAIDRQIGTSWSQFLVPPRRYARTVILLTQNLRQ